MTHLTSRNVIRLVHSTSVASFHFIKPTHVLLIELGIKDDDQFYIIQFQIIYNLFIFRTLPLTNYAFI